jgi:transcriptional regulator with XRE-family HTH domain
MSVSTLAKVQNAYQDIKNMLKNITKHTTKISQKPSIVEAEIGKRIKAIRVEKRFTLENLAAHTGFTKGYLSKVEKSEKSPPVSTLITIARALNVSMSLLLGEKSQSAPICLVKKGEGHLIAGDGTAFGYSYEAVAYKFKSKLMEPFILNLPVNPPKRTIYQHEGQEILFVLEGMMKFHHGTEELIAKEGDCLYFDSSISHFGESVGNKAVKCLMIVCSLGSA